MKTRHLIALLLGIALAPVAPTQAQVPGIIHYHGVLVANGNKYKGTGEFRFAFVNSGALATYWSNDGSSMAGSEPTAAVSVEVDDGAFSVALGDTSLLNMTATIPAEAREALLQQVPLKRIGAAREVAEVVRFLAGDGAAYVTGQVIHVNGGLYM